MTNSWRGCKEAVLSRLTWQDVYGGIGSQQNGNGEWAKGCCPFHEDKTASFSFNKQTLAFKCFAGCGKGSALDYLAKRDGTDFKSVLSGLAERFGVERPGPKKEIARTYDYVDINGNLLHQTVRFEPKGFSQRRKVGEKWVWSLKDITTTIYNLPDVTEAEVVYVFEGEKDCDNVKDHYSLAATTCPMGAGKWRKHHSEPLRGKSVCVVPDNDSAGIKHGTGVANSLLGIAKEVKIALLPDEHNGQKVKDVSDYILSGGTREGFIKLSSDAECFEGNGGAGDGDSRSIRAGKLNELEMANEIKDSHTILYSEAGRFYKYTDEYYQEISENQLLSIISNEYGCLKNNVINLIIRYLKACSGVKAEILNNDKYLNLKNGLFDTENYKLVPHTPDVYSTIRLGVTYDQEAECPLWLEAVNTIIEDDENIRTVQEFFGLCMTKETYDKALFLTGEGSNGKSTLLDVLKGILGDENTCEVSLDHLDKSHYVAQLHNKLLNIASEIGAKGTVYDEMFKKIVVHDYVMGDHKFGHPFSFRPVCKMIFATNTMPRTDDKSRSFYRRMLVVHLTREFTDQDGKHKYYRKLLEERDGIFNWMVEGLKRLKERGRFAVGERMKEVIADYKAENNPVIGFIEERCVVERASSMSKSDLYKDYKEYCEESGFKPLNIRKFGKELQRVGEGRIGADRTRSGGHQWTGIRRKGLNESVVEVADDRPY